MSFISYSSFQRKLESITQVTGVLQAGLLDSSFRWNDAIGIGRIEEPANAR